MDPPLRDCQCAGVPKMAFGDVFVAEISLLSFFVVQAFRSADFSALLDGLKVTLAFRATLSKWVRKSSCKVLAEIVRMQAVMSFRRRRNLYFVTFHKVQSS